MLDLSSITQCFYFHELCSGAEREGRIEKADFSETCVCEGHDCKSNNQKPYHKKGGRLSYKLMQRGVETLDTYLKLILQVLETEI